MRMKPTNVRKKIKGTTECDKSIVTCDVGTTQYKDGSIKSEEKKKEPPNVTKVLSNLILELYNVKMELSNVRKK